MAKNERTPMTPEELQKRKKKNKRLLIFVGATFAFLFIVSVIPSSDDNSSSSGDDESSQPADTSPTGRLTSAVSKATGKSNVSGYGDRIQLLEWTEEQTLIRLLGDENLTSGLMKSANRRLVLDSIEAYQSSGLTSQTIVIDVYYPLVDNVGAEKLYRVLGYGFTQERISAIQTENIDTKRMDVGFADDFTYVHPAFVW
jgi:hypothetical protein